MILVPRKMRFYSVIDHVNDSLFKQMKANGYYTVVLTPFNKSAYNAGHAYTMMGVDKIIQPRIRLSR